MQPSSREMLNGIPPSSAGASPAGISLHELHNGHHQQQIGSSGGIAGHFDHPSGAGAGGGGGGDDFFDQMLSGLPSAWPELAAGGSGGKLFGIGLAGKSTEEPSAGAEGLHYSPYDESSLLATRLRQHQISGGSSPGGKPLVLQLSHHQHQMMLPSMGRSPAAGAGGGDGGLLPLPLTLGSGGGTGDSRILGDGSRDDVEASFKSPNPTGGEGLYNGFGGSLQRAAQAANQQHFHHPQGGPMPGQSYGGPQSAGAGQAPTTAPAASSGGGGGTAPPRQQRVRARRGQATDPHSIAERLRRERIAERMKALQELVPNANKTDKASMLDEIIDYVKFLQLQVKVLSMSRLGGAAAVAPLVADMSSEGQGGSGRSGSNGGGGSGGNDSLTVTEHQVAKLMEEDMGSAMQYLQGKGLCLMPISLASAISSATCHPRPSPSPGSAAAGHGLNPGLIPSPAAAGPGGDNPSSPSMSVLTVQSAMANGADADASRPSAKDAASVSKP